MSNKENIIIITDSDAEVEKTALGIKAELPDFNVKISSAESFSGNDLLPCEIFFIGCKNPSPASFAYLEKMLAHINLASRKCGIFSGSNESIEYLKNILKDSEVKIGQPLVGEAESVKTVIKDWIKDFL